MADIVAIVDSVERKDGLHYRNPRLPVNIKLPDNLDCGTKFYIHGAVAADPTRFSLNLKNGEKDADTYFHFNPRFGEETVVVRNSKHEGAWGQEERDGDSPFAPATPFVVAICATVDGYEVEVNGAMFTLFKIRDGMPLCNITHLTLKGDIVAYGIHVPLPPMPIPLSLNIPGKTCIGDLFCIKGAVPDGADRFSVNFQCGHDDSADIMFHFNPRFGDGVVVCNSRCADCWDDEVRQGDLPVGPGQSFSLLVAATPEAYCTWINDTKFLNFSHRRNMAAACTLNINGDISIHDVCMDCPPSQSPPQSGDSTVRDFDSASVQTFNPPIPVLSRITGGFSSGKVLIISFLVPNDASRMKVNLQCDSTDDSDVALHFNPRWDTEQIVVLNSRQDGEWGEEIREANPLAPGSRAQLYIVCKDDGYTVAINGNVLAEFPHRMASSRVDHVAVDGSVSVQRILAA